MKELSLSLSALALYFSEEGRERQRRIKKKNKAANVEI